MLEAGRRLQDFSAVFLFSVLKIILSGVKTMHTNKTFIKPFTENYNENSSNNIKRKSVNGQIVEKKHFI